MAHGRNKASQAAKDSLWPGDPWLQPLPEVKEGGESVWEAWNAESRRQDLQFAPTQPSEPMPLSGHGGEPPQPRPHSGPWTGDDVMVLARRNNRVCPRPALWAALYLLLEGDHYADLPPPPTQAWLWSKLSNLQKRLRFREHIEWADRHGKLDTMAQYLQSLAEPDWVHMGEH